MQKKKKKPERKYFAMRGLPNGHVMGYCINNKGKKVSGTEERLTADDRTLDIKDVMAMHEKCTLLKSNEQ